MTKQITFGAFALLLAGCANSPTGNAPLQAPLPTPRPAYLNAMIARHAEANGVPVHLALRVIRYESGCNPNVTSRSGAIGLGQILLTTARGMGFTGTRAALYHPETNLRYSMAYLGNIVRSGGPGAASISRYERGHAAPMRATAYAHKVLATNASC